MGIRTLRQELYRNIKGTGNHDDLPMALAMSFLGIREAVQADTSSLIPTKQQDSDTDNLMLTSSVGMEEHSWTSQQKLSQNYPTCLNRSTMSCRRRPRACPALKTHWSALRHSPSVLR